MNYVLDALVMRSEELARKLAARQNTPGFEKNVAEITTAKAEIDAEIARIRATGPEGSA